MFNQMHFNKEEKKKTNKLEVDNKKIKKCKSGRD